MMRCKAEIEFRARIKKDSDDVKVLCSPIFIVLRYPSGIAMLLVWGWLFKAGLALNHG